jgi:hypothetical protein
MGAVVAECGQSIPVTIITNFWVEWSRVAGICSQLEEVRKI